MGMPISLEGKWLCGSSILCLPFLGGRYGFKPFGLLTLILQVIPVCLHATSVGLEMRVSIMAAQFPYLGFSSKEYKETPLFFKFSYWRIRSFPSYVLLWTAVCPLKGLFLFLPSLISPRLLGCFLWLPTFLGPFGFISIFRSPFCVWWFHLRQEILLQGGF